MIKPNVLTAHLQLLKNASFMDSAYFITSYISLLIFVCYLIFLSDCACIFCAGYVDKRGTGVGRWWKSSCIFCWNRNQPDIRVWQIRHWKLVTTGNFTVADSSRCEYASDCKVCADSALLENEINGDVSFKTKLEFNFTGLGAIDFKAGDLEVWLLLSHFKVRQNLAYMGSVGEFSRQPKHILEGNAVTFAVWKLKSTTLKTVLVIFQFDKKCEWLILFFTIFSGKLREFREILDVSNEIYAKILCPSRREKSGQR